ncbi:MAG: helix-turn-helix transcriptional regulator [Herpetosiphonaceae bacterium]|nr:helix-turn-helix transcriptional regulator [Herpetosiphonaceae bacterium]
MHQLTWKQVAKEAGIASSTLSKLRHGEHILKDATVWEITTQLGLLLNEDPKQPPISLAMLSTWPTVVHETFDSWNSLWRDHSSIDAGREVAKIIRHGRYELSLQSYLPQGSTMGSDSSIPGRSTFFMTVEAEQLEGSETGECGLLFGELNDTEFHVFYIRPTRQHFSVASVKNDGVDLENDWHLFYPWQKHSAIKTSGVNHLSVLRNNMSFWFYVNGQVVADIHPLDFPTDERRVDLAIGMGEEGYTIAAYDNFILRVPPGRTSRKPRSNA